MPDTRPTRTPRHWRLGTSLLVSLVLLLVFLISFTFLTYRNVLDERRQAEIDNAVALARTMAAEVDRFIHDLQTTTLAIANVLGHEGIPLDWYDALALPDGRIGLVMGDVAGRGIEAAAIMGQLQNAVRAYAMEGHRPAVIMERVTRLLDIREMATLLYLAFDPGSWTVHYANAGHLPPLVVAPGGSVSFLTGGAPPLGSGGEIPFREEVAAITPGSTIVLYTDGLIEVRGEPLDVGMGRLLRAAEQQAPDEPAALIDYLVTSLLGAGAAPDDVALLALHAAALDPARLRLRLDAVPASMPLLRHTLRRWLEPSGIAAGEVFEITVAVSEAFSNAIEHAYAAADAQIEVDGTLNGENLSVSIRDWGQWRQPRGINRGRGLGLMRGLMSEVKVTPGSSGTTVQLHRRVHRVMSA